MNLLLRGNLERIGPVKGKTNVCLMEVVYKNCPNDLVEIIGDYVLSFEALKTQFENFKDRLVAIDPAVARTMRFNNYVECLPGGQKMPARLLSLGVNRLVLELPLSAHGLDVGQSLATKLYFQTYQFMVGGKIEESTVTDKQRRPRDLRPGVLPRAGGDHGRLLLPHELQERVTPDPVAELAERDFGLKYLYPIQRLVIANVLEGADQIVVLPTGAGKSLCFQLPSRVLDGITLVVVPLLSLLEDQLARCRQAALPAEALRGGQDAGERRRIRERAARRRAVPAVHHPGGAGHCGGAASSCGA